MLAASEQDVDVAEAQHAVERVHPPDAVVRVVNPLLRRLLASRFHSPVSRSLLLLHYRGRRTGRTYTVPVGYHWIDGQLSVLTNSGWRHNFAGGRDIEVTYRGQRLPARAQLIDDADELTTIYHDMITELGVTQAQRRLGIRITVDRPPTRDELREAITRTGLSVVRLDLGAASVERD